MDCRRFEEALFEAEDVTAQLRDHARQCARCADLLQAFSTEFDGDLMNGVLAQTSGDPCAAAAVRLCEASDAAAAPDLTLRLHLANCPHCSALHGALRALPRDLARLARQEPDADFVADVLARTSERRRRATWWQALLQRPRLALEGAYVGTLVAALVFGPSVSAFARTPVQAIEQLREVRAQGQLVVATTLDRVTVAGGEVLETSRQRADRWIAATTRQAGEQLVTIIDSFEEFWGRIRGDDAAPADPDQQTEPTQGNAA